MGAVAGFQAVVPVWTVDLFRYNAGALQPLAGLYLSVPLTFFFLCCRCSWALWQAYRHLHLSGLSIFFVSLQVHCRLWQKREQLTPACTIDLLQCAAGAVGALAGFQAVQASSEGQLLRLLANQATAILSAAKHLNWLPEQPPRTALGHSAYIQDLLPFLKVHHRLCSIPCSIQRQTTCSIPCRACLEQYSITFHM